MVEKIIEYIAIFLALIVVLPLHEFAHAFVAVKCGDYTPKYYGRYTINPLAHFDPLGLACFVFAGFGWAKPVPVNPNNFRRYKLHSFFVAGAGVLANLLTAFFVYPLFFLSLKLPEFGLYTRTLVLVCYYVFNFSITFAVFNLIPIYPLDGFRIIDSYYKYKNKFYYNYKKYSIYVLYAFFVLSIVADLLSIPEINILGFIINWGVKLVGTPITIFWGLIF